MNNEQFHINASGVVELSGHLDFTNVAKLFEDSKRIFKGKKELTFDLKGLLKSNSAGLALLLEWLSFAAKTGCIISFINLPKQLLEIAVVSGLDDVLPISP